MGWWYLLLSYTHQRTPKLKIIIVMFWSVLLKMPRKKNMLDLFKDWIVADCRNGNIPDSKQ